VSRCHERLHADEDENAICVILSIQGVLRPLHEERNKVAAVHDFFEAQSRICNPA